MLRVVCLLLGPWFLPAASAVCRCRLPGGALWSAPRSLLALAAGVCGPLRAPFPAPSSWQGSRRPPRPLRSPPLLGGGAAARSLCGGLPASPDRCGGCRCQCVRRWGPGPWLLPRRPCCLRRSGWGVARGCAVSASLSFPFSAGRLAGLGVCALSSRAPWLVRVLGLVGGGLHLGCLGGAAGRCCAGCCLGPAIAAGRLLRALARGLPVRHRVFPTGVGGWCGSCLAALGVCAGGAIWGFCPSRRRRLDSSSGGAIMDMELKRALKEAQNGDRAGLIAGVSAALTKAQVPAEKTSCFLREAHKAPSLGELLSLCSSYIAEL